MKVHKILQSFSTLCAVSFCALQVAHADPASASKKSWVLLIPGAGSSGDQIYVENLPALLGNRYFGVLQERLSAADVESIVGTKIQDQDARSIEEREDECAQSILEREGKTQCKDGDVRDVVILGHSMGGLIARELAQDPRVSACIKSITTVSTPHRGSPIADFAIEHAAADNASFDFYGKIVEFINFLPSTRRYLTEMSVNRAKYSAENFRSQDIADNAAIQYFSISSSLDHDSSPVEIMRALLENDIKARGLDQTPSGARNDAVVPEYSQFHGTYLGNLEVNHFESACVDTVRFSAGCARAMDFIVPFLISAIGQTTH